MQEFLSISDLFFLLEICSMCLHNFLSPFTQEFLSEIEYRGIHADVIVYIFAHLHTALHTEENLLGKN